MSHIKSESEAILKQAREEQARILNEATLTRNQLIEEAREKARAEGVRLMEEARIQLEAQKETALREIRQQTAELAIEVAEKIMRTNLTTERQQMDLIERLLDEVEKN